MSTGLVMSQTKNINNSKSFSKNSLMKNSNTFSIQKPTKAFMGISQSKSSSDVNSISGNLATNIMNTTENDHSANNNNKPVQIANDSLKTNYYSKIPKSVSTSVIKQNQISNDFVSLPQPNQPKRELLIFCFSVIIQTKQNIIYFQESNI